MDVFVDTCALWTTRTRTRRSAVGAGGAGQRGRWRRCSPIGSEWKIISPLCDKSEWVWQDILKVCFFCQIWRVHLCPLCVPSVLEMWERRGEAAVEEDSDTRRWALTVWTPTQKTGDASRVHQFSTYCGYQRCHWYSHVYDMFLFIPACFARTGANCCGERKDWEGEHDFSFLSERRLDRKRLCKV